MKKIVRQQNYLKELIEAQDNKFISRQTLLCLVRSALEPLLDNPEEGVVLHRIENKNFLKGLFKRLEFSEVKSVNYSDEAELLREKIWANTEFVCILTHRYVSILIWQNDSREKNFVKYYSLYNSKLQYEPLEIIQRNSLVDISDVISKFNPDRRDNILLNKSIRYLFEGIDETVNDAVLEYAGENTQSYDEIDDTKKKIREVSHEIKNQLSICDLYLEIIKRNTQNDKFDKENLLKSVDIINNAIKTSNNLLLKLKSEEKTNIEIFNFEEILSEIKEISNIYSAESDIKIEFLGNENFDIHCEKEKFKLIIINLVKNAIEAFQTEKNTEDALKNGKYIKFIFEREDDSIAIRISNNAIGIANPEKIFNKGFTTKANGYGLGLCICKKYLEEMFGSLDLTRSSEDFTEFTIKLKIAG